MPKSRIELQLNAAEDKIKALSREKDEAEECYNAVIQFALNGEEGMQFLREWQAGEFETCRSEWPEAPKECYIGADPLFKG